MPDAALPQPADVQPEGHQQRGGANDLLPTRPVGEGLRPTMIEEVADAIVDTLPARSVFGALGREASRRLEVAQERGDRLQDQLMGERVAHARTDERLRNGQIQSGAQVLLQILGSAGVGYGLGRIDAAPAIVSVAWIIGGLLVAVFGCWPLISLRIGRRNG